MAIARKFKALIETSEATAPIPDYVWMSYAVCVIDETACSWGGWIIESAWKETPVEVGKTQADHRDDMLSAADNQKCPNCGKLTFRTKIEKRYILDKSDPKKILYSYETAPIEYY